MLKTRDIRKAFYNKIKIKSKYKFLNDKIKDYVFYTKFLSQNTDTGSEHWKYNLKNNPVKTKAYTASLNCVKFLKKTDSSDMAYLKSDLLKKDIKRFA